MKVKRYEGKSEAVLMPVITAEMGPGAVIISVKEKPPKGFFSFLKKPTVIITAACEEDADLIDLLGKPHKNAGSSPLKPIEADMEAKNQNPTEIEESMNLLLQEARKAANQIEQDDVVKRKQKDKAETPQLTNKTKYKHSMVQLFYDTMTQQDVLPDVAAHILRSLENVAPEGQMDVKQLIKAVYGSIVDILKDPVLIETENKNPQTIVFMGPTGVGKTTTIAKLSSILVLKHNLKVGLVTADTYRIAAVEQLRTYADILGLDLRVVYTPGEMAVHLEELGRKCEVVLVDTAGRSHRDYSKMRELGEILEHLPHGSKNYLVLSLTTRYSDLCKTVSFYDGMADFGLIFTKLDETETLGALMNICCLSGKKASYVTFGQNVPDDLETVKPDKVAKSLLGLGEGDSHPYQNFGVVS